MGNLTNFGYAVIITGECYGVGYKTFLENSGMQFKSDFEKYFNEVSSNTESSPRYTRVYRTLRVLMNTLNLEDMETEIERIICTLESKEELNAEDVLTLADVIDTLVDGNEMRDILKQNYLDYYKDKELSEFDKYNLGNIALQFCDDRMFWSQKCADAIYTLESKTLREQRRFINLEVDSDTTLLESFIRDTKEEKPLMQGIFLSNSDSFNR